MQSRGNIHLLFILLLWSISLIAIIAADVAVTQQPKIKDDRETEADIVDFDLKPISKIVKPSVGKLSGQQKGTSAQNAPIFKQAIIDVEILNYDFNSPPELRIFDNDGTGDPIHIVKFAPHPRSQPLKKSLPVPIFLAYDDTPWKNSDHKPKERITRIELHMPILDSSKPVETVYAKLAKDIYVVPVVWHNVTDRKKNGKSFVNNQHVIDLFCRAPTEQELKYPDVATSVNALWAEACVQFRLVDMDVPWPINSIPHHILPPTESSSVNAAGQCGWKLKTLSSPEGVDIFTVYSLDSSEVGRGDQRGQGRIYIKADDPAKPSPGLTSVGFTDPKWNAQARARLVAHEFGHYLGSLSHNVPSSDNLMAFGAGGYELVESQRNQVRQQIHKKMQALADPYNKKF